MPETAFAGRLPLCLCADWPIHPWLVAAAAIASQLVEIGVMLLMFGVDLYFSFDDLLAVSDLQPQSPKPLQVQPSMFKSKSHDQ